MGAKRGKKGGGRGARARVSHPSKRANTGHSPLIRGISQIAASSRMERAPLPHNLVGGARHADTALSSIHRSGRGGGGGGRGEMGIPRGDTQHAKAAHEGPLAGGIRKRWPIRPGADS